MAMPTDQQVNKLFDFRFNITTVLSVFAMLWAAAMGMAKMETQESHDRDVKRIESDYVRRDVNDLTDRELREWLIRIEKKLDERNQR
jgi:hypothetical protein